MSASSSLLQPGATSPAPTGKIPRENTRPQTARTARAPWFKTWPDDGWLTLILLAAVVIITVSSIQAVTPPWAPGLYILTFTTVAGLVLGYLVVQQGRLPASLVNTVAIVLGVLLAFDQTAAATLGGDRRLLATRTLTWFRLAFISGAGSNDNAVFLLFLAILTFLLAFISYWLVVQTRRPWLAVLANGTVLLINLNWATDSMLIFLVLFLLAALLLVVRFTLAENMRRWRARGLRFSPDLSWDFMQAGAIFAVVILLLAYLLPVGAANAAVLQALNDPQGAWQQVQQRVELVFGGVIGSKGTGGAGGFFNSHIRLVGNVDLPNTQLFHYNTSATGDPTLYLASQTFDTYDGLRDWTQSESQQVAFRADQAQLPSGTLSTTHSYTITLDAVGGDGLTNLLVPGAEAASFSVPSYALVSVAAHLPTSWEAQQPLQVGESFVASGFVTHATEDQLRAIPYPAQTANGDPNNPPAYSPDMLGKYLPDQAAKIAPDVQQAARDATKGAANMYDAAVAIEDYLRTFVYSTHNPEPPSDQDATAWFLRQKQGYCTFFASAMALMGRSLGMPTRIASGFINGTYDAHTGDYIVRGTASHVWTQVYFARYGWVNFEPTSSFDKFSRAISLPIGTPTAGVSTPGAGRTPDSSQKVREDPNVAPGSPQGPPILQITLGGSIGLLLVLLALALALIWWRLLYRGLSPAAAAFGRITRLGGWAGAPPASTQTSLEYADRLGAVVPEQQRAVQTLGGIYARERYGGGVPPEVAIELPGLYDSVRAALARVIARRLSRAPFGLIRRPRRARRARGRRGGADGPTGDEI